VRLRRHAETWIAAYRQGDNRSVIVVPADAGGSVVITDFDLADFCWAPRSAHSTPG
jgi:hypothetical protein